MSHSEPTIEVTLRSIDGFDEIEERRILLNANTSVQVGRSSKNAHKNLMAGPDNAYIDSPVISREHATFSANCSLGIPTAYITDNGSMHGTFVNQATLARSKEHKLNNGDILQFGANVVRDQDSFIAKKYEFKQRLVPPKQDRPSSSRGFSVPSDVSTDEEDDVDDEAGFCPSSPVPPNYGSETNPVNVDDFEDMPPEAGFIDLDDEDELLVPLGPGSVPSSDMYHEEKKKKKEGIPSPPAEDVTTNPYFFHETDDEGPNLPEAEDHNVEQPQLLDSQDGDDRSDHTSEADLSSDEEHESSSDDESDANSDAGSTESEASNNDAEEDTNTVQRLKVASMLNHMQGNALCNSSTVSAQAPSSQTASSVQSPSDVQAHAKLPIPAPLKFFAPMPAEQEKSQPAEREATNLFSNPYANHGWDSVTPPTAPSRPVKPMSWVAQDPDYSEPMWMRESNEGGRWFNAPSVNMFSMPVPDYHPENLSAFNRASPLNSNTATQIKPSMPTIPTMFPCEGRAQAPSGPPQVISMTPGTGAPSPPSVKSEDSVSGVRQSNQRTKVSIAEIVEDAPQPPPTPTSVSSPQSLKRKADMFDEEEQPQMEMALGPGAVETPITADAQADRTPRSKKARDALGYVATGAAGFIVGGVAVFGALWSLPESMFQ